MDPVARLEAVRCDPKGWPGIDIGTLLDAWKFKPTPLGWSHGIAQTLWSHEDMPNGPNVVVGSYEELAEGTVLHALLCIDMLRTRQAPSKSPQETE